MRPASSSSPRAISNVSIRKIAERIEYSPAAIYGYFPSKDDIFFALAEEGFRILFTASRHKAAELGARDPLNTIRAVVLAPLRVQPSASRVLRADVRRPLGAAHQPELERFAFAARDEGTARSRGIQTRIDAGVFPAGTHAARRLPAAAIAAATGAAVAAAVRSARARAKTRRARARRARSVTLAGLRAGRRARHLSPHALPAEVIVRATEVEAAS